MVHASFVWLLLSRVLLHYMLRLTLTLPCFTPHARSNAVRLVAHSCMFALQQGVRVQFAPVRLGVGAGVGADDGDGGAGGLDNLDEGDDGNGGGGGVGGVDDYARDANAHPHRD